MVNSDELNQVIEAKNPVPKLKVSLLIIFMSILTTILAEHIYNYQFQDPLKWVGWVAPILLVGLSILGFRNLFAKLLGATSFLVICVLVLALASLLGTGIHYSGINSFNLNPNVDKIFNALFLDDIFNSWWYVVLYLLIGACLIKKSLKTPWKLNNGWFHIMYLSPVFIILGFLSNFLWGWRGTINLEIGKTSERVKVYKGNTNKIKGHVDLPFQIELNDVEIEQSSNNFQIQVLKNTGTSATQPNSHHKFSPGIEFETIGEYSLIQSKIRRVAKSDIHFRLVEFYPNFGFQYGYPEQWDTIPPIDPGIMLQFITGTERRQLQLRANQNNTLDDPHIQGTMEFYWELPSEFSKLLESPSKQSSKDSLQQVVFIGSTEEVLFVYNHAVERQKLVLHKEYYLPGKQNIGFAYQFVFPNAKYITAVPGTLNDELKNPVAKLEVWGSKWERAEYAYVYIPKNGLGGYYVIPGTEYGLGLSKGASNFFKTNISVVDEKGSKVLNKDIGKHSKLNHAGYRFIPIDHSDQIFQGLGVIFKRGMPLIYLGFSGLIMSLLVLSLGGKSIPKAV